MSIANGVLADAAHFNAAFVSAQAFNVVSGSTASPNLIAAAGVVPIDTAALTQSVYIAGNGAARTAGGVYIQAGTIEGQRLVLIGTHATNTVTIPDGDGTGTEGNGDMVHGLRSITEWYWDTARWVLMNWNGL